jgi:hypothetical protein
VPSDIACHLQVAWSALRHGFDPSTTAAAKVHPNKLAAQTAATAAATVATTDTATADGSAPPAAVDVAAAPTPLGKAAVAVLAARVAALPRVALEVASADGTRKLLLRLADGLEVSRKRRARARLARQKIQTQKQRSVRCVALPSFCLSHAITHETIVNTITCVCAGGGG